MVSRTPTLIFAALLLLQVAVSAQAVFQEPVDASRRAAIVTSEGTGAPFGKWDFRTEPVKFFGHLGAAPTAPNPPVETGTTAVLPATLTYPSASSEPGERYILVGSADDTSRVCDVLVIGACVGTSRPTEFAKFSTRSSPALLNMTVYSLEGTAFISALPAGGLAYARAFQVDAAGARVRQVGSFVMDPASVANSNAGRSAAVVEYNGRLPLGVNGIQLPAGHSFEFEVGTATTDATNPVDPTGFAVGEDTFQGNLIGATGALYLDSVDYPTHFTVVADSARINVWTETRQGTPSDAFGPANINANTPANVADRQFLVQVVQANAWGAQGFDPPGVPMGGGPAETVCGENTGLLAVFTSFTGKHALRIRNESGEFLDIRSASPDFQTGNAQTGNAQTGTGFTALTSDGSVVKKTWHFVYPSGFANGKPLTPDGRYTVEAYNDCYVWSGAQHDFVIGKRGFEFATALGETPHHSALIGQATEFAFTVHNSGFATDTFQFAVPNLQGFTSQFSRSSLTLGPGEEQVVTLRLTPPPSVGNNDNKTFSVSAASILTNEVKSAAISVKFTNIATKGLELVAAKPLIETRPGLTSATSIAVRNTGNSAERVLVRATGVPLGWSVSASPVNLDLLGSSRGDVLLQITAPRDAASGQSFTLQLEAVGVNDLSNRATLNLPVTIFQVRQALIDSTAGAESVILRNKGAPYCPSADSCQQDPFIGAYITGAVHSDTDVDRTSLVRYKLTNAGDLVANYTLKAYWDPAVKTSDGGNPPDGVPDRWRFNVDHRTVPNTAVADLGTAFGGAQTGERRGPGFSGLVPLGYLVMQPQTSRDIVLEVGYATGGESGSSSTARLVVQVTDQNDPTFVVERGTSFERIAPGTEVLQNRFSGGQRNVDASMETNDRAKHFTPAGTATTYHVLVKNLGNEMDTLTVTIDPGSNGWTHTVALDQVIGDKYLFNGGNPEGDAPSTVGGGGPPSTEQNEVPTHAGCATPANTRQVSCTLGIRDEIHLLVTVTPPAGATSGLRDLATVQVKSGDDGSKADDLILDTVVGGLYSYTVTSPVTQLSAVRGQQALFPFTISNIGNNADTYRYTVTGPASWNPTLSDAAGQAFLVPGGVQHGFLRVQAPASATIGTAQRFLINFEGIGDPALATDSTFRALEFFAVPAADGTVSLTAPPVLVPRNGVGTLSVNARDLSGTASSVKVWVEDARMPEGWNATIGTSTLNETTQTFSNRNATAVFTITAPSDELSTSRVPIRVFARAGGVTSFVDTEAVLASVFGVTLNATADRVVVAPGREATHTIQITNTGLDQDTYTISTSAAPAGWTVQLPQLSLGLAPLETKEFPVIVTPPANAPTGSTASLLVFASSLGDATKTSQEAIVTEIGVLKPALVAPVDSFAAPQETHTLVFKVVNNGTLADTITLGAALAPEFRDQTTLTFSNATVALAPGRSEDVLVRVTMPRSIQAGTLLPVAITATSAGAGATVAQATAKVTVLPHALLDVDGDLLVEMAVDRNRDALDGLEEFNESPSAGGLTSSVANLTRFLSQEARDRMQVTVDSATGFRYNTADHCNGADAAKAPAIDGDCDGKTDFLLDSNADDIPDAYWDPDGRSAHAINITKDVTGDQVREAFVDTSGDGAMDFAFDLVDGRFIPLLLRDVDGDGKSDYVVDLDGDGQADPDEPTVVSRSGGLVTVTRVDVDGNGQLDEVYDFDGDGNPESFVPAGKTESYAIKLKDVTGDGHDDWTYDADGDGRVDSYYDPLSGESGLIDQRGGFLRALGQYWYIGALFAVVLALFVVLLMVTRK